MLLTLEGLEKKFEGFHLKPQSLTVQGGEFFCLLGPSGCGKTTVLRLIGGFEAPSGGRIRLGDELKAMCKKVGITCVMVTHDQEEALQLSDRIAVMREGNCLQVGTPKEIYEYPADTFVARFIGPVNEIPGEIADAQDGNWSL